MRERLLAWLAGAFGILALLIAAIGLYGVISYMTARRRNEIGIRMALGSSRGAVAGLVIGQSLLPLAIGLALGGAAAILLSRTASTLLFGLSAGNPLIIGGATAVLTVVALAATAVPAVRSARLSPSATLRQE